MVPAPPNPARRHLLLPLVPLYAAIVALKSWMFDRGHIQARLLDHPVISVGSRSAGGAGKTPLVILLADLLGRRGFEVRILTRGYGRRSKLVQRVDPDGTPAEFGDEPLMMARRLPHAQVWVGADRYRAGVLSERAAPHAKNVVYLLDDGFQHRRPSRQIDIVLLTQQDRDDRLIPAGNLREPLSAIARADILVLRSGEPVPVHLTSRPVWIVQRRLAFPHRAHLPKRPLVFCALARPAGFLAMLAAAGITPVATSLFRDHHLYSSRDVLRLLQTARAHRADGFITTEKDAAKLTPAMIAQLEAAGPLAVAGLELDLADEQNAIDALLNRLTSHEKIGT